MSPLALLPRLLIATSLAACAEGLDAVIVDLSNDRGAGIGWLLELSNEVFAAPDGTIYKEIGLAPEVPLEMFPADDPIGGHRAALRAVVELATGDR